MAATTAGTAASSSNKRNVINFLTKNSMTIALVAVFILFASLTGGRLLFAQNMSNLLLQNGYVLVMACGMLLCILTGGNIDLSVGSVICMVGGLAAVLITNLGWNPYLTIPICLLVGLAIGAWQGYWIGFVRIPPFITTLAGMFIFRGIGRLVVNNKTVPMQNAAFNNLFTSYINIPGLDVISTKDAPVDNPHIWSPLVIGGIVVLLILLLTAKGRLSKKKNGYHLNSAVMDYGKVVIVSALIMWYCTKLSQYKGISVMLVWVLAVCLIYYFITSKTVIGRYFYAVGGNEKATKLSGINTNRIYFLAYANMGLLAGLCGMLCLARVGSVSGQTGTSFEMDAIASCFIGGASAYGGSGSVGGVVIGALLLGVLNMGMSILGFTDSWQYVVKGSVLLVAVIFDVVSKRKKG
ncbi:MAG: sugar ABC transporter permease [Clostridia bacterium]|nr:sugar ABC transporter permease [Clostridia bacterium]MBR0387867.1 sugar ABC transporter permease [Clostridia bacterium]MBR2602329.1 sugar ABC transporter permease [Clostridia bacterium]MBR2662885.1 sugar ABC transporter permease [Clostridia bacterium]